MKIIYAMIIASVVAQQLTCWDGFNVTCSFYSNGNACTSGKIGEHVINPAQDCVDVPLSQGPGVQVLAFNGITPRLVIGEFGGPCLAGRMSTAFQCGSMNFDDCLTLANPDNFNYTDFFRVSCSGVPIVQPTSTSSTTGVSGDGGDGGGTTNEANSSPAAAIVFDLM